MGGGGGGEGEGGRRDGKREGGRRDGEGEREGGGRVTRVLNKYPQSGMQGDSWVTIYMNIRVLLGGGWGWEGQEEGEPGGRERETMGGSE